MFKNCMFCVIEKNEMKQLFIIHQRKQWYLVFLNKRIDCKVIADNRYIPNEKWDSESILNTSWWQKSFKNQPFERC